MKNEYIKEKINYYIEMLKIFWAIFIVLTGGLFTILLNINFNLGFENLLKLAIIALGTIFEYIVIMVIRDFNNQIFYLLNKLEKK